MATQGIQLPVSLQISNLQEIANQLKQFSNKNILSNSLGGKKIDSELDRILSRLEQISAKSKTAFTTQSNFTSVEKDIGQIELSLNKVHDTIRKLGFDDLKIPDEFVGQVTALQSRIKELNNSLTVFKGTQKEKLVSNSDFMANLQTAEPSKAAKILEKGYDELFKAVNVGMTRVNSELALKAAEYKRQQEIITKNSFGKASTTQWGALSFIQEAFKALPKDDNARNAAQNVMAEFMNTAQNAAGKTEFTGFQKGALGLNNFLKTIKSQFEFSDEQMSEIKARIRQQVQELSKEGQKATATDVIKAMGKDEGLAKQILFGGNAENIELAAKKYATQIRDAQRMLAEQTELQTRSDAYSKVSIAFDIPNEEIKQKTAEIADALKVPEEALKGFEASILSAATKSPQLTALFQQAAGEINVLTNTVDQGRQKLQSIDNAISRMQGISNFINRYVGLYAIVRKVTTAVRNAMTNIKEIDKAITSIAVVTNMSQADLWGKIGEYTEMAQQYGVATKEVYTVSQIFYQQGLQTSQVMQMTTESLKMAKIAGIDYTTAANAMTVAIRAFKLEMSEAQSVTDTYSALAAKFAVSSSEIANAMEKTASSAASVGMSLQSTSAFISVMEQTTRESAQNIGSALKSIISRYGEMKASPDKLLNIEGEDVAFNKVDTALKSIGISIKDASGQFRDFDDVIMELASKWDSLDNNTQRYIATIMAGNRQQSRFIALVSNYDELSRAMNVASNAENASIVQVAKTMDSLESKTNQLKNAFSQLYLDLHIEDALKGAYDWLTRILKTVGKLGTLKGVLPTLANIIGFGTGAKSLVKTEVKALQDKKSKYQVETTEAEQKIDQIRAKASEDINTKWKIQADVADLTAQKKALEIQFNTMGGTLASTINGAMPASVKSKLTANDLIEAQKAGQFSSLDSIKSFLFHASNGQMDMNSDAAKALMVLLGNFEQLGIQIKAVDNSLKDLENSTEELKTSKDQEKATIDEKTQSEQNETQTIEQKAESDRQATQASQEQFTTTKQVTDEQIKLAQSTGQSVEQIQRLKDVQESEKAAKELEAQESRNNANTKREEAQGSREAKEADEEEARASRLAAGNGALSNDGGSTTHWWNKKGYSFSENKWGEGNALKYAGIATGIARLAGTAITAAGAAHQDKSTDSREYSKIYTGIGNGLSMAGTGASMLMSLGPWGAAIGAIGGFLIGGLETILDGANMTLEEQLTLEKEEAQKASDEALKASAKTTDLSSQIDNLKQLQAAMYNSTEDMQAYKDAMNTMAQEYPTLVSAYDEAGNAIVQIQDAEVELAQIRLQAATAANTSAKAEAQTRQTTIKTLKDAQDKASSLYSVGSGIKTFQDENGKSHSLYVSGEAYNEGMTWLTKKLNELENAPQLSKNATLEEYINAIQWIQNNRKELSKNNQFDTGDLTQLRKIEVLTNNYDAITHSFGDAEFDFSMGNRTSPILSEINKILKNRSQDLNFSKVDGVSEDLEYIYGFMSWDKTVKITAERINEFENRLAERVEGYEKIVAVLDEQLPVMDASESLENALLKEDTSKATKISNSKVAAKLIANQLKILAPENLSAGEWARSEDSNLAAQYESAKTKATNTVVSWFVGLSDDALDKTLDAFSSMTKYTSLDNILKELGYIDQTDFVQHSGLESEEEAQNLLASWQQSFIDANKANKDRILQAIYNTDYDTYRKTNESPVLNEQLAGLNKLYDQNGIINYQSTIENIVNRVTTGVKQKDGTIEQISSQYSEFFTTQLLEIDKIAENGQTVLAQVRMNTLAYLSQQLGRMDNDLQDNLFSIITNVNFSSYDSIISASEAIKEYGKNNNQDVSEIVTDLVNAANNLLFNVNTLAQELTSTITNAAKNMDSLLNTNTSGLAFDKAIEEFDNLQSQFSDITNFNQIFRYDEVLGKYVYTQDGLQKAIQAQEQKLSDEVIKLTDTAQIYTKQIAQMNEDGSFSVTRKGFYQLEKEDFTDAESLFTAMESYSLVDETDSKQVKLAYQDLAAGFIDAYQLSDRTWQNFQSYIEQRAKDAQDASDAALTLYKEFQANKKNQYYQAIDWSKLVLGTDFGGTNQFYLEQLARELAIEDLDHGEKTGRWIFNGKTYNKLEDITADKLSSEDVLDAYLNQLYEGQKNAQELIEQAKTRISEQTDKAKSQQVSNAIGEVLENTGNTLTEETIALIHEIDPTDENIQLDGGKLANNINEVRAALVIYNSNLDRSITELNADYVKILSSSFAGANAGKSLLSSGNKLDLSALESSFNTLKIKLSDFYKQQEDGSFKWVDGFENALTTDIFGETKITDWEAFKTALENHGVDLAKASEAELLRWRNAYIDGVISDLNDENIDKTVSTQVSNLSNIKIGEWINISSIKNIIGETEDKIQITTQEQLNHYMELLEAQLNDSEWVSENVQSAAAIRSTLSSWKTKFNKVEALTGIISERVSYGAAETLATAYNYTGDVTSYMRDVMGYIWDDYTKQFIASEKTIENIQNRINDLKADRSGDHTKEIHELEAALNNLSYTLETGVKDNTVSEILNNYTEATNEQIAALKTAFDNLGIDWSTIISSNDNGTFRINVGALKGTLELQEIGYKFTDSANQIIAQITDTYIGNMSTALDLVVSGTASQESIEQFKQSYQQLFDGKELSETVFKYDELLNAWTLDPAIMREYIMKQAEQLIEQGLLTQQQVEDYINNNIIKDLASQVDISSFLSAENKTGQAKDKLKTQLVNYFNAVPQAIDDFVNIQFAYVPEQYRSYIKKGLGAEGVANSYIRIIERGGAEAVAVIQAFADASGIELSASDIEAAWRTEVSAIEDAFDQLLYGPGSLVSGKAKEILEKLTAEGKASITAIDANNAVVNSITDIAAAYEAYYDALAETGEATLAALNEAKAKVFESRGRRSQEQAAIDALGDASGMTYTTFAEIFTQAGYKFTDELIQQLSDAGIVQAMGGNKMRITDFSAFASLMNWDFNSEEYISAFKTYNDGLIELNHKAEKAIADEINTLGSAKGGDQINVTQLYTTLINSLSEEIKRYDSRFDRESDATIQAEAQRILNKNLLSYGAYIENGILKLDENANIAGIATVLKDAIRSTGMDLSMEIDSILDTIDSIINAYISSIQSGISGNLSHQDASTLRRTAASYGVENLNFIETAEGLKLTNESIFDLYGSIRKINQLSAKKLLPNIKEINSRYGELSSAMSEYYKAIYEGKNSLASALGDLISEYLVNPESYNVMRNKNTQHDERARNLWESTYKAYGVMEESKNTGQMGFDEFNSIMAQLYEYNPDFTYGGKTVKELYETRSTYLTYDKNGNVVYDLLGMGITAKDLIEMQKNYGEYSTKLKEANVNLENSFYDVKDAQEQLQQKLKEQDGTEDARTRLTKIVESSDKLKEVLVSMGGQDLYDKLVGGKLTDAEVQRWSTFLSQFANTDWNLDEFTTQLRELLGEGYTVDVDAQGNIKITEVKVEFADGNIYGDLAKEWQTAVARGGTVDLENHTVNYNIGEYNVKFQVDVNAQTGKYTVTGPSNETYTSDTAAGAAQAVKDATGDSLISALDTTTEGNISYTKHTEAGDMIITYTVDGIVVVPADKNKTNEELDKAIEDEQSRLNTRIAEAAKALNEAQEIQNVTIDAQGNYSITIKNADGKIETLNITEAEKTALSKELKDGIEAQIDETSGKAKVGINDEATEKIKEIQKLLDKLVSQPYTATVTAEYKESTSGLSSTAKTSFNKNTSTKFVQKAKAQGNVALAGGRRQTLMGELGPEMYVQNGHYYVAGQTGPEMVSLDDNAIVFNHLQTERLLKNGKTYGHGKPVTNEQNATGKAHAYGTWNKSFQPVAKDIDSKKLINTIVTAETQAKKIAAEQAKAAVAQAKAAETQVTAANKQEEVAEEQKKASIIPDSNKLHTGYKRKQGYVDTGTDTTTTTTGAARGKYQYTPSRTSTGGWGYDKVQAAYQKNHSNSGSTTDNAKTQEESEKAAKQVISDLLSQGFETIDLSSSSYEKLVKDIKESMQAAISDASASYRDFVVNYGQTAGLTVKEFNEQYFAAWQKDLENLGLSTEIREAAKGLSFYGGGAIGGSAEDWTTLFGEYTDVSELVSEGIIEWNQELEQYIVTSIEALQEFDTNLDIDEFKDIIADSTRATLKSMTDLLSNAESGSITYEEFNKLNEYLKLSGLEEISRDYLEKTANGLTLSYKILAQKYEEAIKKQFDPETIESLYQLKIKALEDSNARVRTEVERSIKQTSGDTRSAVDALTFFGDNAFAATLEQLESLANAAEVDLKEVLAQAHWDEQLQQYIVDNKDAINGIDWSIIEGFGDMVADDINEFFGKIIESISNGLSGSLSHADVTNMKGYLKAIGLGDIDLQFTHTVEGLKLSQAQAIQLYNELKKIDTLKAELVFKELKTSLEESNDNYKTMTSLLKHIADLQEKINDTDTYNDEKIRQYKEELALAKEIVAIRATSEDSSFSFLSQDIPGAMNNPLNYVNDWITSWKELRDAAENDKSVDFQHMYNTLTQINDLAKLTGETVNFLGMTLDGSAEAIHDAIMKTTDALGSDADGSFGVLLSSYGEDLTNGVDKYSNSADNAIHGMAKAQIKILDALIAMFEVIVAMEEFQAADVDKNGLLDLDEIFDLTGLSEDAYDTAIKFKAQFIDAANKILETINSNEEFKQIAEAITLNGHSVYELIQDAADGVRDITDISAEAYQQMVSVLYEAFANGDYDLNDIYNSFKDMILTNKSGFTGNVDLGNTVLNVKYKAQITKNADGTYTTPSGKTYNDAETAMAETLAETVKGIGEVKAEAGEANGTITYEGGISIDVKTTDESITYDGYNTLDKAIAARYQEYKNNGGTLDQTAWEIEQKIRIIPVLDATLTADSLQLDQTQVDAAIGTSFEQLQKDAETMGDIEFKAKYGIEFDKNSTTEEDWARFKELAGIETKNIEVNASINLINNETGESGNLLDLLTSKESSAQVDIGADINEANATLQELLNLIKESMSTISIDADTNLAKSEADRVRALINSYIASIDIDADVQNALNELDKILNKLDEIKDTQVDINVNTTSSDSGQTSAKGNVALAAGRTLMGELGPELYVTNGRYFIAGQNGAEFVNLPKDAIVFNHLQTQRLLSTGSTGRGEAVTTEANAVAFAKGIGPAAASAKQTLNTLKELRAMWQKLAEASIVDLAGVVNKESGNKIKEVGSWLANVERWYNLLQKIARLEKEINYQEALRSKITSDRVPDGTAYYKSQVDSLKNLQEQAATQKELADSYDEYFQQRRQELNSAPISKFYEFDEAGQIRYKEGGLAALADITAITDEGVAKYTPEQQYKLMQSYGLGDYMLRDSSGLKIEWDEENDPTKAQFYRDSVQAGWERMVDEQQEMQDLYNNREDAKVAYLQDIQKANEILQEIVDNQLDIEQKTLEALEEREQKIIDRMTKEREALANSSAKYFEGLEAALSKERQLYQKQQDSSELAKLQRRLAILQRSGGSAAEIASLQQEITDKQRDAYFEAQETAIQEAKDAADLQLEKMQEQIDIATKTLEYQKENGLLWSEVAEIMKGTSESIVEFITTNMPDWQEKSALAQEEELRTLSSSVDQWAAYRDDNDVSNFNTHESMSSGVQTLVDIYSSELMEAWNAEIQRTTPGLLTSAVSALRDAALASIETTNNVANSVDNSGSTTIDNLTVEVNVKELAEAKEIDNYLDWTKNDLKQEWSNAYKKSPNKNSIIRGGV